MMLPRCSHITRKRGIYYYRRRLPGATKRELALSLRTRMFPEAQWLSQRLDGAFERVLQRMAEQNKDRADIGAIAKQYLRGCLDYDLSQKQAWAAQPPKTDRDKWFASIHFVAEELGSARDDLVGRGRPDRHAQLIDMLMDEHKVPEDQRGELTLAILRAHVAKWETIRKRALGDFSDLDTQPAQANDVRLEPAATSPLLSEVLPGFLDLMSKQEEWRGQTLAQNTTTYAMFAECCGDKPVATYERKDLAAFYDLLRALPRLYSKSAQWKGLAAAEIAKCTKEQDHERLAMKTIKRHFSALGRLFAYLKQRGEYTGENPAYGFEFPDKRRTRDKRSMWDGGITSVQRRRRWTASEKVRMVEETFEPGMTVSLVARRHGVAPNQLFTWRRLVAQGGLTAAGSGEEVVPASDYRALQSQVRELHRLLGKKTLETELLKEALERAMGSKKQLRLPPSLPKDGSR